jgi:hypothetical protein
MKPLTMKHDKSESTITVQPGQVENAKLNGWYAVAVAPDGDGDVLKSKTKVKRKVKTNGKD